MSEILSEGFSGPPHAANLGSCAHALCIVLQADDDPESAEAIKKAGQIRSATDQE